MKHGRSGGAARPVITCPSTGPSGVLAHPCHPPWRFLKFTPARVPKLFHGLISTSFFPHCLRGASDSCQPFLYDLYFYRFFLLIELHSLDSEPLRCRLPCSGTRHTVSQFTAHSTPPWVVTSLLQTQPLQTVNFLRLPSP